MRTQGTITGSFQPPRRVRIGARTVTFMDAGEPTALERHMLAVWDPAPPTRWKPAQLAKYCAARDAFIAKKDAKLGYKAILLDPMDQSGVDALVAAAEAMLAAKAAGVTLDLKDNRITFHGDPDLALVWEVALLSHREAVYLLLKARRAAS